MPHAAIHCLIYVQTQAMLLCCISPLWLQVGQLFSSRSDLFPAPFTEELSKLQDRVPAFNPKKAIAIVEAEFGAPVSQLYRSFDELPLAAASLGQVMTAGTAVLRHRCALLSSCCPAVHAADRHKGLRARPCLAALAILI